MCGASEFPKLTSLLDVREATEPRLANCVRIPLSELSERTHELPPKGESVGVLGDDAAQQNAAIQLLADLGRRGHAVDSTGTEQPGAWRLWKPNSYLQAAIQSRAPGTALDLGCGAGRDAVFLAGHGWRVTAIDQLPDALNLAKRLEALYLPAGCPKVEWARADLHISFPGGKYDLVSCLFFLDRNLVSGIANLLAPGGLFLTETFIEQNRLVFGKPRSVDRTWRAGELAQVLRDQDLEILDYAEGLHGGRYTARALARKPF